MRVNLFVLIASAFLLSACGSGAYGGLPIPRGPSGDVIPVGDDRDDDRGRNGRARGLRVPPGHYPPPGECRLWYPDTPPGQQPPPTRCERLVGRVPYGAFVLYGGREWDTRYDWLDHERRNRNSVPGVILDLMRALGR